MGYFIVKGGVRLRGSVKVSGAKNSALPIMASSILANDDVVLKNVPDLQDVRTMMDILKHAGFSASFKNNVLTISPKGPFNSNIPYEPVRKMRASFNVLGPLAARFKRAKVALPGGCSIGVRPVNFHLDGLKKMGFDIEISHGFVEAVFKEKKEEVIISLPFPSVGATEHLMTTASIMEGTVTIIDNAAMEPEIEDLQNFLNSMGAKIKGAGTRKIVIEGVKELRSTIHTVIPDRIEAGTYAIAICATRGFGRIEGVIPEHLSALWSILEETGATLNFGKDWVEISMVTKPKGVKVVVNPYPGFPTDLQPQIMTYLSVCEGTSVIQENVFKSRFLHVDELKRMGADIEITDGTAVVRGVKNLSGAPVKGTDLRATAALLIAGLMADGKTEIHDVEHIFRGYERVIEKFSKLGAEIEYVEGEEFTDLLASV